MAPGLSIPLFAVSLLSTLMAANLFARRLDRLGVAFGLPEALVGLLTALAADGPEISSALIALLRAENGVSVGVVVGSNVFNLAAMVGVSALLAGRVRLARATLLLDGSVAMVVIGFVVAVYYRWLAPLTASILLVFLLAPYLMLVVGGSRLFARLTLPGAVSAWLVRALQTREPRSPGQRHNAREAWWIVSDVLLIVLGSFGMVTSAVALGDEFQISGALIGVLILGPLTSIPNALTAVRLGLAGRGSALLSETLNSNTINLVFGLIVPALFVGLAGATPTARLDLLWLTGMSLLSLCWLVRPAGIGRFGGIVLIGLYGGFVAIQLLS